MNRRIVLATNNAKKLAEMRRIVEGTGLTVLGLADVTPYPEPAETERTFEGNAHLKAAAAVAATGLAALADDSGLEVEELNQMPGVRSARWAGPACDDEANLQLLLDQLDGVPDERRTARFVCALAFASPSGERQTWRGQLPGRIATSRAGNGGFGYDPIFIPTGHAVTSAELPPSEKDAISHRGQALRGFLEWITRR